MLISLFATGCVGAQATPPRSTPLVERITVPIPTVAVGVEVVTTRAPDIIMPAVPTSLPYDPNATFLIEIPTVPPPPTAAPPPQPQTPVAQPQPQREEQREPDQSQPERRCKRRNQEKCKP